MPLLALWKSNPIAVSEFTIEQVVAAAGNGELKDSSICSDELRTFLAQVATPKLAAYVERCLSSGFAKSGMVLQDLINELGRRLDFDVENGRYQGITNAVGFDGIWKSPEGRSIVIEVKTSDAYRLSLDKIADYRMRLISSNRIGPSSSILIVVGRDDTGELEAQVRGSRHAWDIRLISTEALLKLVQLKENGEDSVTGRKIRSLLFPMEYTRLDDIIDVMFATASDIDPVLVSASNPVEETAASEDSSINSGGDRLAKTGSDSLAGNSISYRNEGDGTKSGWEFTDSKLLQAKRELIIKLLGSSSGKPLIKKTRALYWDASHSYRVACSISKRYTRSGSYPYWYAFHPQWDQFLSEGTDGYFVLGCMDQEYAFRIPWKILHPILPYLNTTTTDRNTYWHIHVVDYPESGYSLQLPKKDSSLSLKEYIIG